MPLIPIILAIGGSLLALGAGGIVLGQAAVEEAEQGADAASKWIVLGAAGIGLYAAFKLLSK